MMTIEKTSRRAGIFRFGRHEALLKRRRYYEMAIGADAAGGISISLAIS